MPAPFIAVHCGAGLHKDELRIKYNKLCRLACRQGAEILRLGGTALEAVKAAIIVLESNPLTNAGCGANLTTEGQVELDAGIMDGRTLIYGGCGALKRVKHPIALAYDICTKQKDVLPMGLVPPSLLVGDGADNYAKTVGLDIIENKTLVTRKAVKKLNKCKRLFMEMPNGRMDTVGAVCIDSCGHVAAGCSSGGLLLKRPGRIGQAALFASGTWADSFARGEENCVAVSTTGCGEHLVATSLAKEVACDIKNAASPIRTFHATFTEKFIKSRHLQNVGQKLAGALVLQVNKEGEGTLLWGHTSETMSVGYMQVGRKPKATISRLPEGTVLGVSINVEGIDFTFS